MTGTSMRGPMTAAQAMPNRATPTAIANSKLLLAAVDAKANSPHDLVRVAMQDQGWNVDLLEILREVGSENALMQS
jgi:hypothetical protein